MPPVAQRRGLVLGLCLAHVGDEGLTEMPLLPQAGALAGAVAQVVKVGAPHMALAQHLDLFESRRVDRELPFHPFAADDADKTTIVFALPSTPGSLFRALSVFALRDINLSKLESRPIRGRPWEYLFYVDIEARRDDLACARALAQLGEFAKWTRVLGTYKGWQRNKG